MSTSSSIISFKIFKMLKPFINEEVNIRKPIIDQEINIMKPIVDEEANIRKPQVASGEMEGEDDI